MSQLDVRSVANAIAWAVCAGGLIGGIVGSVMVPCVFRWLDRRERAYAEWLRKNVTEFDA